MANIYGYTNDNDEQVGKGQIRYELVCYGLHALVHEHETNDEKIAHKPCGEYDCIDYDQCPVQSFRSRRKAGHVDGQIELCSFVIDHEHI
jgi:hypothetical protein